MTAFLLISALAASVFSGVPGLFMRGDLQRGQNFATALNIAGAVAGLLAVAGIFTTGTPIRIEFSWPMPFGPPVLIADPLSAVFLIPIFLISPLGAIYGEEYWPQIAHPENGRMLRFFYGLLTASVALIFLAGHWVLFLFGWEIMAIAAYFLVTTEDHDSEVRNAGWIYLVSTHTGTLAVLALVTALYHVTGTFAMTSLGPGIASSHTGTALILLAIVGFGFKAGIMPFHIWLPPAHSSAPSHVSAIMSGVLIKTGIYGLVRFFSLVPDPPLSWGGFLLALGLISGILGVAFALGQHDLKRLLAYHSIENIGIIVIGLGLGMAGRALDQPAWIALGFGGALLHVVNHALFKSLLFYGAGAVIHATGTREMDRLGGLLKLMPKTALAFLTGAVAICGLPPLNGFVSEWLIFVGLFDSVVSPWFWGAFAAPGLALIGALALACFVKAFGAVFLGTARSREASAAHEPGPWIRTPFLALGVICLVIGIAPFLVAPLLDQAVACVHPSADVLPALASLSVFPMISCFALALLILCAAFAWLFVPSRPTIPATVTWDCGYAAPTSRMQYTSSSFADGLVKLSRFALRPEEHRSRIEYFFERTASFSSHVPDFVLDLIILPSFHGAARIAAWSRWFQQGRVQIYLLYIAVTLIVLMAFV
ncbi:MAG: proton-conducting transporter membrane subunit [Candidatus Hydrogenedentota bacterium]